MHNPHIQAARKAAVGAAIDKIRGIELNYGVTRQALDRIKAELLKLANQRHLFPLSDFPPPPAGEKSVRRYLLQEDEGGRFAIYVNAANPGNKTQPHDHTTWAAIAGIEGQELNRLYKRT